MGEGTKPRAWGERSTGMPTLPGQRDKWVRSLRDLIGELSGHQDRDANRQESPLPKAGGLKRHELQRLVRAGLLSRQAQTYLPSTAALTWYHSGASALLVQTIHHNVRFVGEILDALASGPRTHEELLDLARTHFDLPWETVAPVRDRTTWLAVTEMVDLFEGRVHLTQVGRDTLSRMVMGRPEPDDDTAAQLTPAVGAIAHLIEQLDDARMRARADGANLYIPGTAANGATMDSLKLLTEAAMPSIEEVAFAQLVKDTFPKAQKKATARTARDTLKALGLIERKTSTTWSATPAAIAWVESGDPLDLARTVHASIAFFGEMLGVLGEAAWATTGSLAEQSTRYLPNRGNPLSSSAVNARLSLMEVCGLVTRLSQTTYRVTALGKAFQGSVPCLLNEDSPNDSVGNIDGPEVNRFEVSLGDSLPAESLGQRVATELENSARDSANPMRLEKAAVAALAYLGMPGEHVGGNRAVDGRVRFGIGANAEILAVEAKTAASGRVVDQTLFNLAGHRVKIGAEVTLLVGPGFSPSMLKEADDNPSIAVIETGLLAEVVRRQRDTPLTPDQLKPLIDPLLSATQRREPLSEHWRNQEVRGELEYALVDILNVEAEDPLEEGGWLDLTSVRRELRTRGYRITENEVLEALDFLASSRIGVLDRSAQGYRCTASVHTAGQRIRSLGHQWAAAAQVDQRLQAGNDKATASRAERHETDRSRSPIPPAPTTRPNMGASRIQGQ